MEWRDEGVILSVRKYGEFDAIVDILTRGHGRRKAMVKGAIGRRQRGNIQPGNEVNIKWRGRLESQLGTYSVEMKNARSVAFLYNASKLAALNSCTALLSTSMAENEVHEAVLDGLLVFLDTLQATTDNILNWGPLLIRFELGLLSELGFGLKLDVCAATGQNDNLVYVSPKSGQAVSEKAGAPYHDKMLKLPLFLTISGREISMQQINDGFRLTEFFMERHIFNPFGKSIPQARQMIIDYII